MIRDKKGEEKIEMIQNKWIGVNNRMGLTTRSTFADSPTIVVAASS